MLELSLISFVENIKDLSEKYSNIKDILEDNVLENELFELGTDTIKFFKILNNGKKAFDLIMFKSFIEGFSIEEDIDEKRLEQLYRYIIDSEEKAIFVTKTLDRIFKSKSKYAVFILGYILNTLIKNEENLQHKYIILADSLTYMFDHDILNIRFIGDYCNYKIYDDRNSNSFRKMRDICVNRKFLELLKQESIDKDIFILTLEKCISYQLIRRNIELKTNLDLSGADITYDIEYGKNSSTDVSTGTASADSETEERYCMTMICNLLYDIIIKLGKYIK